MDSKITNFDGSAVKIASSRALSVEKIDSLFGKYGRIQRISFEDDHQIIYFQSDADAIYCVQKFSSDADFLTDIRIRKTNPSDLDSTGDTILNVDPKDDWKTSNGVNKNLSIVDANSKDGLHVESTENPFLQNCSSPVLMNTMDPGFRLAYCHNVTTLKPESMKSRKLHQFNRSIKKYMDNTPKVGSHELVVTNLPPDFKVEDIYQLCGKIEPETVDVKATSNTNVIYANIKVKSKEDFEKLTEVLGNRQINGTKIVTIPITKITQQSSESTSKK